MKLRMRILGWVALGAAVVVPAVNSEVIRRVAGPLGWKGLALTAALSLAAQAALVMVWWVTRGAEDGRSKMEDGRKTQAQ